MAHDIPIIILSDDDADEDNGLVTNDSSVIFVENEKNQNDESRQFEELDEDLAITFSRTATLLPHARYDCTLTFCRAEKDVSVPLQDNVKHCDQCFCYICDTLASMCEFWSTPNVCHCNAHKHSSYWKDLRAKSLMGHLYELEFTFDPVDIDNSLQSAKTSLKQFSKSLKEKHHFFLNGLENNCQCQCQYNCQCQCQGCYLQHVKFNALEEPINTFLSEALRENPKQCVVMLLGALKLLVTLASSGNSQACASFSHLISPFLWRIMARVWTLLVASDLTATFINHLQNFIHNLPRPMYCTLPKSLNVLPWDDPLLSSVLKGQNITGQQKKSRKLQILIENHFVIEARVSRLQQQNKYRELSRYLKVVRCGNNSILRLKDLIPFFLCKDGNFNGAVQAMFSLVNGAACTGSRLTPSSFNAYLRIFSSGHAPVIQQMELHPENAQDMPDPFLSTVWMPVEGSSTMKQMEILKFALRILDCNQLVFRDSESWQYLLRVVSAQYTDANGAVVGACYPEPDADFFQMSRDFSHDILKELTTTNRLSIPKVFQSIYPDQARLLLATQALIKCLFISPLNSITNILLAFKSNCWALGWMFRCLVVSPEVIHVLLGCVVEELLTHPLHNWWDEEEHSLIAKFLRLYFLESSVTLHYNMYPMNKLLDFWNEQGHLWQRTLRLHLERDVFSLAPDKLQILKIIQKKVRMSQ